MTDKEEIIYILAVGAIAILTIIFGVACTEPPTTASDISTTQPDITVGPGEVVGIYPWRGAFKAWTIVFLLDNGETQKINCAYPPAIYLGGFFTIEGSNQSGKSIYVRTPELPYFVCKATHLLVERRFADDY